MTGPATGNAIVDVGGRFMTGAEMSGAAEPFGMTAGGLYFRGRIGAAGDVPAAVAVALLGIFPPWLVEMTWGRSAALPSAPAVRAYTDALHRWGRNHPVDERLADLAERVVDAADGSFLALFTAWRVQPRPDDAPARAAHALMLLRELRGGLHFAAVRAEGLDVPAAVVADPCGGETRLRRTGWRDEETSALLDRAGRIPDLRERRQRAEATTERGYVEALSVLGADERAELDRLITTAEIATRA